MAKRVVVPKAVGPKGKMVSQLRQRGGQTRMRRQLAEIRRTLGAAAEKRAMKKWNIRAADPKRDGRGSRGYVKAKNG